MGRVKSNVSIDGQNYWALFDCGAMNTYVIEVLIGALAMEEWGIVPIPKEKKVDIIIQKSLLSIWDVSELG